MPATTGRDLRRAREAARLSQAEVARRLGTTQPAVARWERGAVSPSLANATRFAEATGHRIALVPVGPPPEGFGAGLRTAREAARLSRPDMAWACGLTVTLIREWEDGVDPPPEAVADALVAAAGDRPPASDEHPEFALAPDEKAMLDASLRRTPAERVARLKTMVRFVTNGRRAMAEAKAKAHG